MKRPLYALLAWPLFLVGLPLAQAQTPDRQFSIGVESGAGADIFSDEDSEGSLITLEYEFKLSETAVIAARVMAFDYDFDNDEVLGREEEDGDGTGVGAEFRWYVQKESFDGFWLGVGVGVFFDSEWENREDFNGNGVFDANEITTGDDTALEAHFSLGYTFRVNSRLGITPTFIVGTYESDSPEAGVFGGLGVRFNIGGGTSGRAQARAAPPPGSKPAMVETPRPEATPAPIAKPEPVIPEMAAAEKGNPEAQFKLGYMYGVGRGVRKDGAEAAKWYRRAATQGHAGAQYNLGATYANGTGVLANLGTAVDWFFKAGQSFLNEGKRDLALQAANSIERLVPGHRLAGELLSAIRARFGQ